MTTTLFTKPDRLEPVFGWIEEQTPAPVEIWGLEQGRRAALLAYGLGGEDEFGWSNWAREAREDPSELVSLFDDIEIAAEETLAGRLKAEFAGALADAPSPGEG